MATTGKRTRTAKATTKATTAKATTAKATTAKATTSGARRAATKSAAPKKRAAAKQAVKRAAKTAPARKTAAAKRPASQAKAPAKRPAASHGSDPAHYTDPALRDRLKNEILAGEKGGRAGQWSARKAQLLAHAYETAGGGYHGGKSPAQHHLDEWTHEQWTTADGKPARRGATTARYLPKQAWDALTPAEQRATDKKKRGASKTGQQFVANTARAAAARHDAT